MLTTPLEARIRALEDREAIRDLARQYAHCVWQNDIAGAAALFAEDGVMDTGDRAPLRGRAVILETYTKALSDAVFQPFVHNHVVSLHGDEAEGTCYLDLRQTRDGRSYIGSGFYEDRYRRIEGAWKFQSRKLVLSYLAPLTEGWAETEDSAR